VYEKPGLRPNNADKYECIQDYKRRNVRTSTFKIRKDFKESQ